MLLRNRFLPQQAYHVLQSVGDGEGQALQIGGRVVQVGNKDGLTACGDSHIDEIAAKYNTRVLAKLPIDPDLAALVDAGKVEAFAGDYLDEAADMLFE